MAIVYDEESLDHYVRVAVGITPDRPVLIDKFLEQAAEFDVDALADDSACVIAGIQEHIEEAGIHSGDSSCVLTRCANRSGAYRDDASLHPEDGEGTFSAGFDERAICDQGPSCLRSRSKPTRLTNCSFCLESYRCTNRADCSARDVRIET